MAKSASTQDICDSFHGGGETWKVIDVLIRIEDRIWAESIDTLGGSPEEKAYFDAFDIVRELRRGFEDEPVEVEYEAEHIQTQALHGIY